MLFFLLGLVHMLPWSFFITAYDVRMVFVRAGTNLAFQYWMHKFRDTSYDEVDSSHRTSLQTQFSPSLTISIHVSTVLSQLWALLYGRRYSVNMKLSVPLSILLLFFVIEAIFIVVDTDSCTLLSTSLFTFSCCFSRANRFFHADDDHSSRHKWYSTSLLPSRSHLMCRSDEYHLRHGCVLDSVNITDRVLGRVPQRSRNGLDFHFLPPDPVPSCGNILRNNRSNILLDR
jgi:hypothetical protein